MQKRGPSESRKVILFRKKGERPSLSADDVAFQVDAQRQLKLSHAWQLRDVIRRGAAGEELTDEEKREFRGWDQAKFQEVERLIKAKEKEGQTENGDQMEREEISK